MGAPNDLKVTEVIGQGLAGESRAVGLPRIPTRAEPAPAGVSNLRLSGRATGGIGQIRPPVAQPAVPRVLGTSNTCPG
jgi:hypothetical protein